MRKREEEGAGQGLAGLRKHGSRLPTRPVCITLLDHSAQKAPFFPPCLPSMGFTIRLMGLGFSIQLPDLEHLPPCPAECFSFYAAPAVVLQALTQAIQQAGLLPYNHSSGKVRTGVGMPL